MIIDKCGIEIVKGCQLYCLGCPNSTIQPKIERIAISSLDKMLRNIDVRHINLLRLFNFGEPLLHKNLSDVLLTVRAQNFSVGCVEISTNAQFADWQELNLAIRTRVLNRIAVSCDGDGTPEEYERLRPPSKWKKLEEFLKRVRELRDEHDPELSLITRTICNNVDHQKRWKEFLLPLGWVPEFRDWMYLPQSTENMTGKNVGGVAGVCSFVSAPDRLYVDVDGTVVPCCVHPRAGVYGNLLTHKYTEIIKGEGRRNMAHNLIANRANMSICNECQF